ncbi:FMN-binding negative transcriptional regulator [Silanimonas sp.]|uniref:FMN-binding negative transcriptional regulator n=1 Tax=Silanimonas sp. TaxID=1929290 RepID=UPI0022C00273|nr:FMN-binding negative transcriptional regulator [Silanimonas sp.]MCZ8165617.1 FMN-binding negative transcriptional regulator [Silanimonas sp.]
MYQPAQFAEHRPEEWHRLIREHPLGMLVTATAAGLEAEHLPFVLEAERGPTGTLLAHVARANPVWRAVGEGDAVMVVFRGVQGYISPSWYPSKHEHHRHVPTWNYEVVHVHGRIRVLDDTNAVRGTVAKLTRQSEAGEPVPWKMGDAPADYLASELAHIVAIEIAIERIEGKRKLSQNRDERDFRNVVETLEQRGELALAEAMRGARPARS